MNGASIDAGAAFTHLWKAPGGKGAIAIGGLMWMLFFLLFIPLLISIGWQIDYGRAVARGERELPQWRFGQAWTGLKWFAVQMLFLLPGYALVVLATIPLITADAAGREPSAASAALLIIAVIILIIYSLGFAALLPAVQAIFIAENRVFSALRPSLIKRAVRPFGWGYLIAPLLAYAASFLGSLGFVLCFVGYFFTSFWALTVGAHLAGQVAGPLASESMVPEPATT